MLKAKIALTRVRSVLPWVRLHCAILFQRY